MILKIEAKIIEPDIESKSGGRVLYSDDRIIKLSSLRLKDLDVFEKELMHNLYLIKQSSIKMAKNTN